jgi:hypothetical protein
MSEVIAPFEPMHYTSERELCEQTKEIAETHPLLSQLLGRRRRLERELSNASSVWPLQAALIERLVEDLTATENAISDMKVTNV